MSEKKLITEFLLAIGQGSVDGLKSCLAKNVNISATSRQGRTAIITASLNKHYDCISLLIVAGADIDRQDQTCFNPFLINYLTSDLMLLHTILPANPDLNCLGCFGGVGITPASERGHAKIMHELLLRIDINVSRTSLVGWAPLLEAIVLSNGGAKQQGIVKLLLDRGANLHMTDKYGRTPLELTQERGYRETAELLITTGAWHRSTIATTPLRRCVRVLTAGGAFLIFQGIERVEQAFSHAVNLLILRQQRMLTLLSEDCDDALNSCRMALTHYEDLSHPGERVSFNGLEIIVGNDKWVETAGCLLRRIPRWTSDTTNLTTVGWQHWEEVIHQQLKSDDTLFLHRGDDPFYQEITRQLLNRRQTLLTALRTGENTTMAVSHLVGLGIELMPSSDDYLVGLSTVLFIPGHPLGRYRNDFLAALQRARNSTALLSKITLEEAFSQRYRESIGRLLNQFITEQQPVSTQYITDIKNIGSSSDYDMLYDMADACALSHRFGGNYVDQDSC